MARLIGRPRRSPILSGAICAKIRRMEEKQGARFRDAMPVGIVVERRLLDNPWQAEAWLPVAVVPGTAATEWRGLPGDEARPPASSRRAGGRALPPGGRRRQTKSST